MDRGMMGLGRKLLLVALLATLCFACSNVNEKKPTSTTNTTADAAQRPVAKRASSARLFLVSGQAQGRELSANEAVIPGDRLELELNYQQAVALGGQADLQLQFSLKSGGQTKTYTWLFSLPGGASASRRHRLVRVLNQDDVDILLAAGSGSIEMSITAVGPEALGVELPSNPALTMPAKQPVQLRLAGRAAEGEEAGFPLLLERGKIPSATLTVRRKGSTAGSTAALSFKVNDGTVTQSHPLAAADAPASLKLNIPSAQLESFPDDAEFEVTLTAEGKDATASFKPALLLSP